MIAGTTSKPTLRFSLSILLLLALTSVATVSIASKAATQDSEGSYISSSLVRLEFREPRILPQNTSSADDAIEFERFRRAQAALFHAPLIFGAAP